MIDVGQSVCLLAEMMHKPWPLLLLRDWLQLFNSNFSPTSHQPTF